MSRSPTRSWTPPTACMLMMLVVSALASLLTTLSNAYMTGTQLWTTTLNNVAYIRTLPSVNYLLSFVDAD
eukprot:3138755-Heterocapsa_arctica.AAC.1